MALVAASVGAICFMIQFRLSSDSEREAAASDSLLAHWSVLCLQSVMYLFDEIVHQYNHSRLTSSFPSPFYPTFSFMLQ